MVGEFQLRSQAPVVTLKHRQVVVVDGQELIGSYGLQGIMSKVREHRVVLPLVELDGAFLVQH
jgi:hypothetical protein